MWSLFWGLLWAKPVENPVALAAQLARDGEYSRAESVLSDIKDDDFAQDAYLFHITQGLIFLNKQEPHQALEAFIEAQNSLASEEYSDIEENISLYIIRCHLLLRQPQKALAILSQISTRTLSVYLMKIEALSQKKDWIQAYIVQQEGAEIFPHSAELYVQDILIASKLGLRITIHELLDKLISYNINEDTLLHIAGSLRDDGHLQEASLYLDLGRKQFFSEDLWKASAIVALEQQEWSLAGDILSVLCVDQPSYALETAQAYAQAGSISKALLYNSFAPASSDKLKQLLSLLLQQGSYELVATLEKELLRTATKLEDSIRYGIAYAHFQRGLYHDAKDSLVGISDPKIFRQSVALQKAIYRCLEGGCL